MSAAAVEVTDLRKTYGDRDAVTDLSLAVPDGSFTVLLGPSGCGKSTTLAVLAGLVAPDAGVVRIGGRDVTRTAAERRPVSLVLQKPLLFGHLDVAGNVAFGLRMRRTPRAEQATAVDEALGWVRLEGYGARRPHELSGGQEQRVALARALVLRPDVLLLDEPFSQLDATLRAEMRGLVRELHARTGTSVLLVTHDLEEAVALADQLVLMDAGRVSAAGTPEELFLRPPSLAAARATRVGNEVRGTVTGGVFVSEGGSLRLATDAASGAAVLVVRPEHVELVPEGTGAPASVRESRFAGDHVALRLRAEGGESLAARAPLGSSLHAGDAAAYRLRAWHVFGVEP